MTNAQVTKTKEMAPDTIILFGEEKRLKPLAGRQSRIMVPRVIQFLSRVLGMLLESEQFDIWGLFSSFQEKAAERDKEVFATVAHMLHFLSVAMGAAWEEFDRELLPFLLQADPKRLETEGDPFEVYYALYRAIRFYVTVGMSDFQRQSVARALEGFAKNAQEGDK